MPDLIRHPAFCRGCIEAPHGPEARSFLISKQFFFPVSRRRIAPMYFAT
jgi:hypothetical protein